MPSRAEVRVRVEQVLRAIVIVSLALMLWQSLRPSSESTRASVRARGIGRSGLARWSAMPSAPERIQLQLDSVPSSVERAWLGALRGAGSSVTWSGDVSPLMVDAQPIASPAGGTRVFVASARGTPVVLSDEIGAIDTLHPQNFGAAVTLGASSDRVSARAGASRASTSQRDSLVLHKVLVIGSAGWESKFVVAALEEEGWKVDAFIRLAPGVDVTQGSAASIDTSRYSAIIALDSTAAPYANRIVDFARKGGGVILESQAAALDAMAPLRAGAVAGVASQSQTRPTAAAALTTLPLNSIVSLRQDAIPIERRSGAVASAARRIGAGRALQIGYEDSWRWRMSGGDDGLRDHRRWWTGLVSSVAYAPRLPRAATNATPDDPAPLADLVASVGPGNSSGLISGLTGNSPNLRVWLFVLFAAALIGEVASRRTRGAA